METSDTPKLKKTKIWTKIVVLVAVCLLAAVVYMLFGEMLTLKNLAENESKLREFQTDHPLLVYGIAFLVYVAITGLSIPGASGLSLLYGWYFGFVPGVILVSFASTTGATVAFLLSRYLFRDAIQSRFGDRLAKFNESLEREGAFYLFTLRLLPNVPFFVINAVMGLTPIKTRTFWWVSQVGMLAGTIVYLYAGSSVQNLTALAENGINGVFSKTVLFQIVIAFTILGVFPFFVRWIMKKIAPKNQSSAV